MGPRCVEPELRCLLHCDRLRVRCVDALRNFPGCLSGPSFGILFARELLRSPRPAAISIVNLPRRLLLALGVVPHALADRSHRTAPTGTVLAQARKSLMMPNVPMASPCGPIMLARSMSMIVSSRRLTITTTEAGLYESSSAIEAMNCVPVMHSKTKSSPPDRACNRGLSQLPASRRGWLCDTHTKIFRERSACRNAWKFCSLNVRGMPSCCNQNF